MIFRILLSVVPSISTLVLIEYFAPDSLGASTEICIDAECGIPQIDGNMASMEWFLVPKTDIVNINVLDHFWQFDSRSEYSCIHLKHFEELDIDEDDDDPILAPAVPCLTLLPHTHICTHWHFLLLLLLSMFSHRLVTLVPTGLVRIGFHGPERPRFAHIYDHPGRQTEFLQLLSAQPKISSIMFFS